MLNLCTAWEELGKHKGSVGVTTAFIKLIELVYHENKADAAQRWTPAFQLNIYTSVRQGAGRVPGSLFSKAAKAQAEDLNQGPGTRDGSVALWQSNSWKFVRACRMRNEVLLLGQISWQERSLHLSFPSAKSSVILLESNHLRRNSSKKDDLMRNSKCPLHILFIFKPNFYGTEAVGLKAPLDCSSVSQ